MQTGHVFRGLQHHLLSGVTCLMTKLLTTVTHTMYFMASNLQMRQLKHFLFLMEGTHSLPLHFIVQRIWHQHLSFSCARTQLLICSKNQVFFVWCESDSRDLLYQALIPSSNADEISYNPNQASVSFPQQNNTQTTPVVSQSKQPHNLKFSVAEKHKCLASNVAKLLTTFSRHHDELLLTAAKHNLFVDTGGRVRLRAAQTLQMFNQLSNEKISDSRKITQRFKYLTKTLHNKNVLELLDEVKRVGLQKNSTTAEPGTQPALEKKEDALATSQNSVDISTCAAKLIHGDVIRAKLLDKTTISGHFDAFDEKGIWVIVSRQHALTCTPFQLSVPQGIHRPIVVMLSLQRLFLYRAILREVTRFSNLEKMD